MATYTVSFAIIEEDFEEGFGGPQFFGVDITWSPSQPSSVAPGDTIRFIEASYSNRDTSLRDLQGFTSGNNSYLLISSKSSYITRTVGASGNMSFRTDSSHPGIVNRNVSIPIRAAATVSISPSFVSIIENYPSIYYHTISISNMNPDNTYTWDIYRHTGNSNEGVGTGEFSQFYQDGSSVPSQGSLTNSTTQIGYLTLKDSVPEMRWQGEELRLEVYENGNLMTNGRATFVIYDDDHGTSSGSSFTLPQNHTGHYNVWVTAPSGSAGAPFRIRNAADTITHSSLILSTGSNVFSLPESALPAPNTTLTYLKQINNGFSWLGAGSFTITRPAQPESVTITPVSATATEGTAGFSFTVSITSPSVSTYFYRIFRESGTIGSGEFTSSTSGTFSSSGTTIPITFWNDSISEIEYQGESFILRVYRTNESGALVASANFTIYDDDAQISYPRDIEVSESATSHSITLSSVQGGEEIYRILDSSSNVLASGTTSNGSISFTINRAPAVLNSALVFRVQAYNGQQWIEAGSYTVRKGTVTSAGTYGLQLFDENENLVLNLTDTVGFVKGFFQGTIPTSPGYADVILPANNGGDKLVDVSGLPEADGTLEYSYTTPTSVRIRSLYSFPAQFKFIIVNQGT